MSQENAASDRMVSDAVSYVLEILPKNPVYAKRVALDVAIRTGAIAPKRPSLVATAWVTMAGWLVFLTSAID
jgi:hypothetical protein